MLLAAALLVLISMPGPADQLRLEKILICPDRLPDDAARLRNTEAFIKLHTALAPNERSGERMALRDRLLARKGCRPQRRPIQYSFPES